MSEDNAAGEALDNRHGYFDAIERWADDYFTQGEVAVVMRLVEEFGWRPPRDMCHNGHPFVPGVSVDSPGESDPRWCNTCGVVRVTPLGEDR